MTEIELCRAGELPSSLSAGSSGAVVVDLFRATSTLQVLVEGGHRTIGVVTSPAQAKAAAASGHRCVGEWLGVTPPGFACGNSPLQAQLLAAEGPPVTFLSSNGAGALASASRAAPRVLAASLFNLEAVQQALLARGGRWLIVPAGARGRSCLEDDYVCALLARRLRGQASLGARISRLTAELSGLATRDLRDCPAARRLARMGPAARGDVDFILSGTLRSARIPVYHDGAVTAVAGHG